MTIRASRPRIVIVGAGFAGAFAAQGLEKQLRPDEADVLVLDRHNYFVFTPLLLEAGTGNVEPRHTVVPIRAFLKHSEFRMAEVAAMDLSGQTVTYRLVGEDETATASTIHYDHLILTPGSTTRLPNVPGLREFGYQVKSLGDAVALRDRAIRLLEQANASDDPDRRRALLHIIIVGGNFTGAEAAGEFDMFLRAALRSYRNVRSDEITVTLVELTDRILASLGPKLSDYATNHLRKRGVDVRLNTTVESIARDHVRLSTGETLAAHTVLWCAGIAPSPLVQRDDLPRDEQGYVLCERDLRVKGFNHVWAAGDSAVNPDPNGNPYPATAQHAVRQGKHLGRNIAAVLRGDSPTPCNLRSQGSLAALGCRTGVAEVMGLKLSGFPAWWLWRTVYLLKMPTLSRKLRVALDWTMDLFFSRDVVQLGVHREHHTVAGTTLGNAVPPDGSPSIHRPHSAHEPEAQSLPRKHAAAEQVHRADES